MKVNGFIALVAVHAFRSLAFSPPSFSFLAKSRTQIISSFGVRPLNAIDPETELKNDCNAFDQDAGKLSGNNVKGAWTEYSELVRSWLDNDTMSLEDFVRDFNKSVLNNSSSSSSSSSSPMDPSSIDKGHAVQENGREQLVEKIIDAFIRAKQVENRLFTVITEENPFYFRDCTLDGTKRVFLSNEGDEISTDIIHRIESTGLIDGQPEVTTIYNDDEVSSWLTKVLGAAWKTPQELKEDLVTKLNAQFNSDDKGTRDYIPDLVDIETSGRVQANFEPLCARSSCLCVAGESGAGKTSYVQNHVRPEVKFGEEPFEAALYISLDKDSTNEFGTGHSRSEKEEEVHKIIQDTRNLIDQNGTSIDDKLGNIQTHLFENRDKSAMKCLNDLIEGAYPDALQNYKGDKLNSLMLIIDETGYDLEFTRALISQSRRLLPQLPILKDVTKYVRLVLCGTGLDLVEKEQGKGLGSDPSKYTMVKMTGVNTNKLADVYKNTNNKYLHVLYNWIGQNEEEQGEEQITVRNTNLDPRLYAALECINESWRARNLATNARMLRYGIIPCLCNDVSSGYFDILYNETQIVVKLREHLLDPSKDNFLYSYPVRRYMSLNGMKDLNVTERNTRLDTAFDYLHAHTLASLDVNETLFKDKFEMIKKANKARKRMNVQKQNDFDDCVRMGLCTKNPELTSSAMKYLICKGYTFPFATSKGLAFEKMVALHLVRFYEWKGKKVSLHTLRKQIPDKTISVFNGTEDIKAEWETMKKTESDVYVILQPMENNAQGPDIMVLRNCSNDETDQMTLDLYQAKHYKDITKVDSDKVLQSLFLKNITDNKGENRTKEENTDMLLHGFGGAVIGKRYLQASCKFSDFFFINKEDQLRKPFKKIYDESKECDLLSKEWLEPTFSLGFEEGSS